MPKPTDNSGFTLLEVVIALAIVGIALVTLIGLQARTVNLAATQQRVTEATLLAQEKMTEIEISGLGFGSEPAGVFAEPFELYSWTVTTEATPLPAIEMVTVSVAWGERKNNEAVDLTSFVTRTGVAP